MKVNFKSIILILIFSGILCSTNKTAAQCDPTIIYTPAQQCSEAIPICNLDEFCYSMQPGIWGNNMLFCNGNFSLQNPHWFSFIPGGNIIDIKIKISNCQGGNFTAQWALLDNCNNFLSTIGCNGGGIGSGGVMEIYYDQAVPGVQYYLVVDGSSGGTCDLEFDVIQGTGFLELGPVISDSLTGGPFICPGNTQTFGFGGYTDADEYIWSLDGIPLQTTSEPVITAEIPALTDGKYELCVNARSQCDSTGETICWNVTLDSKRTINEVKYICEGDSLLFQNNYYPTGNYEVLNEGGANCIEKINLTILPFGAPQDTIYELTVCNDQDQYDYNGVTYKIDSVYNNVIFGSSEGCRFESNLILKRLNEPFTISAQKDSLPCLGTGSSILKLNGEISGSVTQYDISWFDEDDSKIGSGDSVKVYYPGTYYSIITQNYENDQAIFPEHNTLTCYDRVDYAIKSTDINYPAPVIKLLNSNPPQGRYIYHINNFSEYPLLSEVEWIAPANVAHSAINSSIDLVFTANGTYTLCAKISHECFETDTICIDIIIDGILDHNTLDLTHGYFLKSNPVSEYLNLKSYQATAAPARVSISDLQGIEKITGFYQASGNEIQMNVSVLPPGIYIYQIKTEKGKMAGKFVKI